MIDFRKIFLAFAVIPFSAQALARAEDGQATDSVVTVRAAVDTVAADTVDVADTVAVIDTVAVAADTLSAGPAADTVKVVTDTTVAAGSAADSADTVAAEPQEPVYAGPYLLADGLQSLMVNFDGKGGSRTVSVKSSTGWWYLDGSIPWCEIKNCSDSTFVLKCYVNSEPLARHSYIKVKTQGVDDASVAVVQASLQDNFLSTGAWRDSLKDCREFFYGGRALMVSEDEFGFEDCPNAWFYVGDARRGYRTGRGCCYDRYGNLIYSGEFYKNIPAGEFPGRDAYSNYKFECQKFSNGTLYLGETFKGLRHGYGIFMSSDGTLWFGRWNCGQQVVSEGTVVTLTSASSDFWR